VKKWSTLVILGLLVLTQTVPAGDDIKIDVKEKVLSNGMKILVAENHIAPVFSTIIRFRVGAVDEHSGITGISHFLEHMLFKGTKIIGTTNFEAEVPLMRQMDSLAALMQEEKRKLQNPLLNGSADRVKTLRTQIDSLQKIQAQYIVKDELWETYLKNGGSGLNASTGSDGTQYYVSLPANRLELWAFLEADRLANLQLREFYSERDVIREERRQSTETRPRGLLYEALSASAHWSSPYRWQAIGWGSDNENYPRAAMEEYFRTYYAPSNAIACIVGDVRPEEVFALCEKYFGAIPASVTPPPVFTDDAPQNGERVIEVEFDANPAAMIGWHMPQAGHPDMAPLDLLSDVLSRGRTARFYKGLTEKKIARGTAGVSFSRYPDLFTCNVTPMGNQSLDDALQAAYAEIDRLKTEPISQWELDRVKTQYDADLIRSLASNSGLAGRLANMEAMVGSWQYLLGYRDAIKMVTAEDIMRAAQKYLVKSNRTMVKLVKPETALSGAKSGK
jgi:predicted Zn-dependent peptidase